MNKFEQVSSDGHQISLAGDCMSDRGQGDCTVRFNALWVIVTLGPPPPHCGQTDIHLRKHYLPTTSLTGCKCYYYYFDACMDVFCRCGKLNI